MYKIRIKSGREKNRPSDVNKNGAISEVHPSPWVPRPASITRS